MFRRVEECNVGAVGPGCGGSDVALLTDDGRVAPLRFVEAGLVDLYSVRLVREVGPEYCKRDLHPSESRESPI